MYLLNLLVSFIRGDFCQILNKINFTDYSKNLRGFEMKPMHQMLIGK